MKQGDVILTPVPQADGKFNGVWGQARMNPPESNEFKDASGGSPRARGRLPLDPPFEMLLESRKSPRPCRMPVRR